MAELCCGRRRLRESCGAGESREVWLEPVGGSLVAGEDTEGPLTQMIFGEEWHRSMVTIDVGALTASFGASDLEAFLLESDEPICDLMDLLDARGLPYAYQAVGSGGVGTLRRSPSQVAA